MKFVDPPRLVAHKSQPTSRRAFSPGYDGSMETASAVRADRWVTFPGRRLVTNRRDRAGTPIQSGAKRQSVTESDSGVLFSGRIRPGLNPVARDMSVKADRDSLLSAA
jgi:hypothetical protein